jgi:hypothetical protein
VGRIRTVKPEFFEHSGLYDAEQETGLPSRLGFAGLWTCCDREGRFKWRPRELKLDVLPYDDCDFSRVLDALATRGFLVQYESGTEVFGYIPSWKDHQFVNNKEPKSKLPEPSCNEHLDACFTRDERVEDANGTRGVKEGKGKEGKEMDAFLTRSVKDGNEEEEELTLLSIPSTASAVTPSDVVSIWNTTTKGKLPAAKFNDKRKATIKTRLKESGWLEDFRAACSFLAETAWYSGANDRGWVAMLDYLLRLGKATELAEKATQPAARAALVTPKPKTLYEIERDEQLAEQQKFRLEAAS